MNPKQRAAEKAVEQIKDGMIVGLGSGSTANWAIQTIADRMREGLRITAVSSSVKSENLAKQLGIPMIPFSDIDFIDLTIDGADEVDIHQNLIKGGGGSLLREKVVAASSRKFIVIVDESKLVNTLGRHPLPVEIIQFASNLTINKLQELQCEVKIRQVGGKEFITDSGNIIVDCSFGEITNPLELNTRINLIPGVVENGLFIHAMVNLVVVGYEDGKVKVIQGITAI